MHGRHLAREARIVHGEGNLEVAPGRETVEVVRPDGGEVAVDDHKLGVHVLLAGAEAPVVVHLEVRLGEEPPDLKSSASELNQDERRKQ